MANDLPAARIPVATYRLQFNRQFGFAAAHEIVPYLNDLGISDIYASSYLTAKEGSMHGYDVVDQNRLNWEIGTADAYADLVGELEKHAMGHILDFVPNHMCIESTGNLWWMDVLENGPCADHATYFDINWQPVKKELTNKVLLPLLGDQYGKVLENGELKLVFEEGTFALTYYQTRLPLEPTSWLQILKHRLDVIEAAFSDDAAPYLELLSIITALQHLPGTIEHDPEKIAERYREKEVVKKRLLLLCSQSVEILNFITENVAIFNGRTGDPASFDLLDQLLRCQVYRLSFWKVATEEINYRRFFDINALSAIRMEDPLVFKETHELAFRLIREGKVTGLRIDHVDGLYDPLSYLERLQRNCFLQRCLVATGAPIGDPEGEADFLKRCSENYSRALGDNPGYKPFYVVCEKILLKGEQLPEDWPVFGTTGYDFLNYLNGIFIDPENLKWLDRSYTRFIRQTINFTEAVYEKKKLVMQVSMSGEINTLGHYLNTISEKNRLTRDFTLISLTRAITEVIACFPVYRTYANSSTLRERDVQYVETAVAKAKRRNPAISTSIFDFLRDVLLLRQDGQASEGDRLEWLEFVMKFQQLTGPITAKGLEDTAFYVYNRLVSLNEVGGAPDRFGVTLEAFHTQNGERFRTFPHSLLATATHDSKRGEDVRTRIDVLSEVPEKWQKCLVKWSRLNKRKKTMVDGLPAPGRNDEYLLYQTLVGSWPVEELAVQESVRTGYKGRIRDYMVKATREAKIHTSWINPNAAYEKALADFIDGILGDGGFVRDLRIFAGTISHHGMLNSLSQVLLKIASPGIPDFYQGTELWDLSLVDPDNRRPVDFRVRREMLQRLKSREAEIGQRQLVRELLATKDDGAIKLYLIYRGLNYRRAERRLFENGEYLPIEVQGVKARHGCAFARRWERKSLIVAACRWTAGLIGDSGHLPVGEEVWGNTALRVPWETAGGRYRNIFSGEVIAGTELGAGIGLELARIFADAPVAMLERIH